MVCQGYLVLQAHQDLQEIKVSQDVMEKMARKDLWDSRGHKDHRDSQGYLEKRACLGFQVYQDPLVLQVPKVNLDHLQTWIPAPEFQVFLGYQAQEVQKELWAHLVQEDLQDQQVAKGSQAWMAEGARMASLGLLGLQDTEGTLVRQAALDQQVLLGPLGMLDPQGSVLDSSVASFWSCTVRPTKNPCAQQACPSSGLATACYSWKGKRRLTTRTLGWQVLAFLCLARCLLPTATSTKCATMPGGMTNPTGWPVQHLCLLPHSLRRPSAPTSAAVQYVSLWLPQWQCTVRTRPSPHAQTTGPASGLGTPS